MTPKHLPLEDSVTIEASNDTRSSVLDYLSYDDCVDVLSEPTIELTLRAKPNSSDAIEAVRAIVKAVYVPIGRDQGPSSKYLLSIDAIVADVLRGASYSPPRRCYRPMAAEDFTGGPMSLVPFGRALGDLAACGFVSCETGKRGDEGPGFVTRIWPTPRLTNHLASYGIFAKDCRTHFTYPRYADYARPIKLRASSTYKKSKVNPREKVKVRGRRVKIDWKDSSVITIAARMNAYNRFLSKHVITGPTEADLNDVALYRSYNRGNWVNHGYKFGGRMFPHGNSYLGLKRDQRSLIRIDGEKTVEVDISACFLTLAYYLLGMPLPHPGDPYAGTSLPRPIVKSWINMTLSNRGYHKDWLDTVLEKLATDSIFDVPDTYPIKAVEAEIRAAMPVVDKWMESSFSWADLHYEESEIMLAAMERLAFGYDVASLPIHDSLRVPASKKDLAVQVIRTTFLARTGLIPVIKE